MPLSRASSNFVRFSRSIFVSNLTIQTRAKLCSRIYPQRNSRLLSSSPIAMTEYKSIAATDFKSDTVTTPTPSMLQAMLTATHGDDVYKEDKTTNDLQARVAEMCGKPAGLFVVSGTMGNQICLRAHLHQPPHSILCDYRAHVYTHEAGGLATLSQAMVTPVHPRNKIYLTAEDIEDYLILGDDIHTAPTRVISLENTLGGTIMPIEEIAKISTLARQHGIKMHLDGARLWNAAAETGVSLSEYAKYFDTMSLCISKGLGAPVGTVIVGEPDVIQTANWFRKQAGGGIRQAGLLAAAADVAITETFPKLKITHEVTKKLASELEEMGLTFQIPVQTNFIFLDLMEAGIDPAVLIEEGNKLGITIAGARIAIHYQTSAAAIEKLKLAVKKSLEIAKQRHANGTNGVKKPEGSLAYAVYDKIVVDH
ncbi:pyridoxal phosphate-dependent transferase [Lipomyces doorenjongii]|uniref:pyridoxal phosphate-dependent transferase n=1 Tax=Lipomyces doorenjongii TaxID=383834 RepID=UPI0034CEEF89